ncbi:HesB/IscA family protein [Buchnera aphidicola]|uniref:Iron-sulfur cluster assembly accessory protein n=1 Tax=Buchnera aphidicola (Aphis nerii) TaxID=1241835 RepID=A0A4D6XNR6_9GAMM|nr:iron-sulfur cluster assembly accessory protein [Buchnera aphidicola]QCI18683.1 iron-sulfur cluster assembly accessory protein [Buchnera aphidicola (Aphis nerii)]
MKEKQNKSYLFNQYKLKGIKITQNAIKQILFLINLNTDNKGIKITVKKSGCAGFRYIMELINSKNISEANNIAFIHKNILIQIDKKDIPLVDGIKIDFIKNNINQIFKFSNPKLDKFCGCGESFSIN